MWMCAATQAAPWIQQNRWMLLGPIQNHGDCWGEIGFPNVTPGHDLTVENPAPGDDWSGEIPFMLNAPTQWIDLGLAGAPAGDVVDFSTLAVAIGVGEDRVKAAAVIYAENTSGTDIPVGVCTASDDSIRLWINDTLVTDVVACRGTAVDCAEIMPGVLRKGKNKITVVVWEGGGGWGFRLRLIKPDGSNIDDTSDPDVQFSTDPTRAISDPFKITRSVSSQCAGSSATVTLKGNGKGAANGLITVTENVAGTVNVTNVTAPGQFTPVATPIPCNFSPLNPRGAFADARDLGGPCFAGSTVYDNVAGSYQITAGGDDIWAGGDQFQFSYKKLSGDFSITAHIAARLYPDGAGGYAPFQEGVLQPASRWGKFGLMARQDCTSRSRYAFTHDCSPNHDVTDGGPDPDGIRQAGRPTHGGADNFEAGFAIPVQHPDYIRLDRVGNVFTSYASTDGVNWSLMNSMDWGATAPCEVFAGLAVTSHAGCNSIRIIFDQVSILGGARNCPPPLPSGGQIVWANVPRSRVNAGLSYTLQNGLPGNLVPASLSGDEGVDGTAGPRIVNLGVPQGGPVGPHFENFVDVGGATGGSTTYDAATNTYTQTGSGNDIWDGGDDFQFVYKMMQGDFDFEVEVVERVDPAVPGAQWGKHGLMARKACTRNAKYTHNQTNTGGDTDHWPRHVFRRVHEFPGLNNDGQQYDFGAEAQKPRFMMLTRRGDTFTSSLGKMNQALRVVEYRPLGSDTWFGETGEPIMVGFATLKHESSNIANIIKFKVLYFGPPRQEPPIHNDGIAAGDILYETTMDELADWQVNVRSGAYIPQILNQKLRLTSELNDSSAVSVLNIFPIDGIDSAIYQFDFDLKMSRDQVAGPGEKRPADGMTFVVTGGGAGAGDFGRVGTGGADQGYGNLGRTPANILVGNNSFAVEFDTWAGCCEENGGLGAWTSPRTYHLGVDSANQVFVSVAQTSQDLPPIFPGLDAGVEDPSFQGVHARVQYNRGQVSVWVKENPGGDTDMDAPRLVTNVVPISHGWSDQRAIFGFTGGTGGATENVDVDNFSYRIIRCNDIPEVAVISGKPGAPVDVGTTVRLGSTGSSAGTNDTGTLSYVWSIVSGPGEILGATNGQTANVRGTAQGVVKVRLTVNDGACDNPATAEANVTFNPVGPTTNWVRCDCNGDRLRNISDAVSALNNLFLGVAVPCAPACNCNGDSRYDISDPIWDLSFQFLGGAPPPPPYPACDTFSGCGMQSFCPGGAGG
jgi:hypothetical protein